MLREQKTLQHLTIFPFLFLIFQNVQQKGVNLPNFNWRWQQFKSLKKQDTGLNDLCTITKCVRIAPHIPLPRTQGLDRIFCPTLKINGCVCSSIILRATKIPPLKKRWLGTKQHLDFLHCLIFTSRNVMSRINIHKYSCFSAISTSTERENKQRLQT